MKKTLSSLLFRLVTIPYCILLSGNVLALASNTTTIGHPFLLVNSKEIEQIRRDITDTLGWKYRSWKILKQNADALLIQELEIPARGGNWEHYYVGPSGYSLMRGKLTGEWQWEHIDTVSGQVLHGDTSDARKDYDGVIISAVHNAWALGALQLGLAYQISGNPAYAQKAREILMAYTDLYPTLPARNRLKQNQPDGVGVGKIHVQNLNEAIWLMDMAQATDLVWNTLHPDDREKIIQQLFLPAVALFTVNRIGWNIQCWQNAAIGMIGFLTDDQRLIKRAMEDTLYGFNAQLKNDVGREGMWIEPSLNYHFFSLQALVQLDIAARNYGYPVDTRRLQKMFDGPLDLCSENYSIPAFNDSGLMNLLLMEDYLYEWAYTEYKDERYLSVFNNPGRGRFENSGPHFTGWGLIFGDKNAKHTASYVKPPISSKYVEDMGLVMLSAGKSRDDLLCYIKYDNHIDPHSHPDNLAFDLMKGKENLVVLSGATNYFSPLYAAWYRNTLSSNSFLVEKTPQKKTIGRCLSFGKEGDVSYTILENTNMYAFPHGIRTTALLNNDLLFVFDQINIGTTPRILDIAVHPAGKWTVIPTGNRWTDTSTGYNLIKDASVSAGMQEACISTTLPSGRKVTISARQDSSMDIITGYGKKYLNKDLPIAIFRRKADRAVMAWCVSSNGEQVRITMDRLTGLNGRPVPLNIAARITLFDLHGNKWSIISNPYKVPVMGRPEWSGKDFVVLEKPASRQ